MKNRNNRILAIDPGSRELGYAVLDNLELLNYGVKNLKRFRPENVLRKTVRAFMNRIIEEYAIKIIVLEKPHFSQTESPFFRAVYKSILQVGNKNPIKVVELSPELIRKHICEDSKPTKANVAKVLSKRYPETKSNFITDFQWKKMYWQKASNAIAAANVYVDQKNK